MGSAGRIVLIALSTIALIAVFGLFRAGYFVFDRTVFGFQIDPILKSGEIKNINQYRIVLNYVEMMFEKMPENFELHPNVQKSNAMLTRYDAQNP